MYLNYVKQGWNGYMKNYISNIVSHHRQTKGQFKQNNLAKKKS